MQSPENTESIEISRMKAGYTSTMVLYFNMPSSQVQDKCQPVKTKGQQLCRAKFKKIKTYLVINKCLGMNVTLYKNDRNK